MIENNKIGKIFIDTYLTLRTARSLINAPFACICNFNIRKKIQVTKNVYEITPKFGRNWSAKIFDVGYRTGHYLSI